MSINRIRSTLYTLARLLGWLNAALRGKVAATNPPRAVAAEGRITHQQEHSVNATHTPGPWHIGAEKSFVFLPGIVKPIACGSQANAALIAAAPELLEALREGEQGQDVDALRALARRFVDNAPIVGRDKELAAQIIGDYARFVRVARAAIAKAAA